MSRCRWYIFGAFLTLLSGFGFLQGLRSQSAEEIEPAATSTTQAGSDDFEMYSTLAGKMARMEELMNGIDRFLGDPDFADRLEKDAGEFHQLLSECVGLFPENLPENQQASYNEYVEKALEHSTEMQTALVARDDRKVKQSFEALDTIRRKSHARFSD